MTTTTIPQTITISLGIQEASNMLDTITAAIELASIRSGHTILADNLTEIHKTVWNQFADQVISVTQPELYQKICEQRRRQQ